MFFLSLVWMCIVTCVAVSTSKPGSKDAATTTPDPPLITEKLLKTSQPHFVSSTEEGAFLIQVIRCRSKDANTSKVFVNTTVEKLPADDETDSDSLTSLNITVKPSTVSNHTFYIEGFFVWSSNSKSVHPTAPPEDKWVVRMKCYDSSSEETVYSEAVMETLTASLSSRAVNVPKEHAANPLNLLPGTVVLPLQVCVFVCTNVCIYVWRLLLRTILGRKLECWFPPPPMCVCKYVRRYVCAYVRMCMYVCMCICECICGMVVVAVVCFQLFF